MKKLLSTLFLVSTLSFGQTYLQPEENKLILGGLPNKPNLESISKTKSKEALTKVINEQIEYRYINGSCEDRAHFISLILEKEKIKAGKIWAFAPAKYSLISNELIKLKDPYKVNDSITWGYHVAPIAVVESDTLVLDLSFDNSGFITKREWLNKLNSPRSIYFYTDNLSYLFNSLNGLTVWNNNLSPAPSYNIPNFIPSIISGDFWSLNLDNDEVYAGMAINDLAYKCFELIQSSITANDKLFLNKIITDIDLIENEIANKTSNPELSDRIFITLKEFYSERYVHWKERYEFYLN